MMKENELMTVEIMHLDYRIWMNKLSFFEDEIKIYESRLEKLVDKSNDQEMLSGLEHYQNQFIRQKEVLDILKHDINEHEHHIVELTKQSGNPSDASEVQEHKEMKERMEQFEKIYAELKQKFYKYLIKWK